MTEDYGSDLDCWDDLNPLMVDLDPSDPTLVAQAAYHRLFSPRGTVLDDPNYGFDLTTLLHKPMTKAYIASIPGLVRAELLKDDRIDSVDIDVKVRQTVSGPEVWLDLTLHLDTGPFEMSLSVTADNVRTILQ